VKKERSASVPNPGVLRTSGLASHPPFQPQPQSVEGEQRPLPPQPERLAPERPPRPRRASVPSILLNRDEVQAVSDAMADLGLQNSQARDADTGNIGFAVTNGSNPKRRSRSVGAVQADHRMSPIQWRSNRRRSDEIRYWRESTDLASSQDVKRLWSPEMSPRLAQPDQEANEEEEHLGEHAADFNFGLPPEELQGHERIGLEERLLTLELKVMDFEYSISKMQAGSTSPLRRPSRGSGMRQGSIDSHISADAAQAPTEPSPMPPHSTSPPVSHRFSLNSNSKNRPTSVATTMKAGPAGQYTPHGKGSADFSNLTSLTGLTIEHYTTLVSLIRNERFARMHLEEQVSQLQKRLERLSSSQPSGSPYPSRMSSQPPSQHVHTYSQSSQQRRHGMVEPGNRGGGFYQHSRRRSSSYSTNETDTDDDGYYVTPEITPVERGEYERGTYETMSDVAEGAVF